MKTELCNLLGIKYPIISGGMVWCSGWRLAAAVSNCGGLGLIGAGSMHPDVLTEHIEKCATALSGKPFGVNVPLMYPEIESVISIIEKHRVPIVFTSAGNPATYTSRLKAAGCKVVHVVASVKFALKAQAAGVDAVVCEGFEAGGHNGRDEITTMVLVPQVVRAVKIPVIAAGGIATGDAILAAMALGADGVQLGTRFALAAESSAHDNFKNMCVSLSESDTMLCMKKLAPVRLIKNELYNRIAQAEARGAAVEELREILGSRRSKLGIFEGELSEGELEIGQIVSLVRSIDDVQTIFDQLITEFQTAKQRVCSI